MRKRRFTGGQRDGASTNSGAGSAIERYSSNRESARICEPALDSIRDRGNYAELYLPSDQHWIVSLDTNSQDFRHDKVHGQQAFERYNLLLCGECRQQCRREREIAAGGMRPCEVVQGFYAGRITALLEVIDQRTQHALGVTTRRLLSCLHQRLIAAIFA